MKPSDLPLLCTVSPPTLAPDGSRAVFAVTRPDLAADASVGQLWQVPTDGSAPAERLTRGSHDTAPQLSPDGRLLAFLRAAPGTPGQLHVVRSTGGEPVPVTDQPLGVTAFDWSPDGARLVFLARVPEPGRYGTVDGLPPAAEPARRITTTRYLANGVGWVTDRRAQVFLVDVPDVTAEPPVPAAPSADDPHPEPDAGVPTAVQLTTEDADHAHPRFGRDARTVTVVVPEHDGVSPRLRQSLRRLVLDADGGVAEVTTLTGHADGLHVLDGRETADGTSVVLAQELGPDEVEFVGTNPALHVLVDGGRPRRLTDPETVDLTASPLVVDGAALLVTDTTRGTVQLLRVTLDGQVRRLTEGSVEVEGVAVAAGVLAVSLADPRSSGDVAVLEPAGLRRLTDLSAPLREAGVVDAEEVVVATRDGGQVHGWVLVPPGPGPHPTLLLIHGGPYAQYTGSLFDEAQVYAAAGYGVVMGNPRGAAGYGQAFGRSIRGRMGTVDLTDVLDLLDGAVATHPTLDAGRVGVMGGSYGGYLTAWTTAHDHRFAGAVVERGFLDPELFLGTSDIGTYFAQQYTGADPEQRRRQSPQAVVGQVRTPTLVVHSEDDLRCPLSQAQRYHLGLVEAGVPTELLVFPGEDHELSRSGRPRHRLQRFDAILDWWDRYLPTSG
ncbi:Dipeptidyl aminopeptidase/acylaminoacyl peptidase [Friedmanniella luteola]|uniref:Dipeptidyl aminopeptidase/acylaminoacyl peptidase n=1 Tax=Friedmanniella luteola TaxID=546871 RepID=A0A1H1S4G6_9ACTN|nr:S9 family peptidase [Friedmanniella luteola]SDS42636.1 Dipeptidyl aminopeptidase/acylaminoacyl peptidase [Friedmanniella luteola]